MPDEDNGLSVVIPAFNAGRTVSASIQSAFRAGAREVIVVDDGSTDDTAIIARQDGARVIFQANAGAAAARRAGITASIGAFVVLLDADDRLIPQGVSTSIATLRSDPHAVAAQGVTMGRGSDGGSKALRPWSKEIRTGLLLSKGHASGPPAAFVWRAEALRAVISDRPQGLWPRYAEDYEFLIRGSLLGRIVTHDDLSAEYEWGGGKSSLAPLKSVTAAEQIRRHYAALTSTDINQRSPRQLRAMSFHRRAAALTNSSSRATRLAWQFKAAVIDPVAVLEKVLRRLRGETKRNGNLFWSTLRADMRANPRDPKARMIMLAFRICQAVRGTGDNTARRLLALPLVAVYRFATEFGLGIELRPKTVVGAGLSIFHGTGLVVNDHAVIGRNVELRNGVTIGHKTPGGGSPRIGNRVSFGAGAIAIGDIEIGDDAVIGAGSVVIRSVPAGAVVAGNPARIIRSKDPLAS